MDLKIINEDISKIAVPEILYKYRTWSDAYHQGIISNQSVFMASPTSFEDEKDCKLLKRFDLMTKDDIYTLCYSRLKLDNPLSSDKELKKRALEAAKNSPLNNKEETALNQQKYFADFDLRFGVLSLTANQLLNAMWEKYSDNHKGFCVGFDSKIMFNHLGGGGPVNYFDVLPDIVYTDSREVEHIKQVFSKEKKWEFEQEYRTHMFRVKPLTKEDRCIKLPKECYKQILFGMSISAEDKNAIIEICKQEDLKVDYYQAIKLESGEVIQKQL
jgi:hypothetical protein